MRRDSGQAMLFMVFALMGLVAITSLVIDGGSWFRTQRQVQTAADAAALAGAQDLPDQATARQRAIDIAQQQNFSGIAAPAVTFPSAGEIDVVAEKPVSGIFMPALNATARAHARAAVSVPANMKGVAPLAVKNTAACFISDPTCFNKPLTVNLDDSQIGALDGWINLDCHDPSLGVCKKEKAQGGELSTWIEDGYGPALPANQWYGIKTGGTNGVKNTLDQHFGETFLIPVWDQFASENYHIIGWAAFELEGVAFNGQSKKLTGRWVKFFAHDVPAGKPIGGPDDFGVHVINLTQ